MLPQLIYIVRFISCIQTPEGYYLCTIVSNTLVFILYFIFLLAFTHRRSYSLQTIKLKYFLLRDFRTTKMAILSQNIQIYHISQVNMAYCLVMMPSSPKYCTFSASLDTRLRFEPSAFCVFVLFFSRVLA